jgi:hypothetical protein
MTIASKAATLGRVSLQLCALVCGAGHDGLMSLMDSLASCPCQTPAEARTQCTDPTRARGDPTQRTDNTNPQDT